MPSGHTTEYLILLGSLIIFNGYIRSFIYGIIPACVIYSRIASNRHHSIDILGGIILASIGIYFIYYLYKNSFLNINHVGIDSKNNDNILLNKQFQYRLLDDERKNDAIDITYRYYSKKLDNIKILKNVYSRLIYLVNYNNKDYVLKFEGCPINIVEKAFCFIFYGSAARRLYRDQNQAVKDGCDIIGKIYLAAERQGLFFPKENIFLLEYIPGQGLESPVDTKDTVLAQKIRDAFVTVHKYKLSMCDVHPHNLITNTDDRLYVIDLCGVYPFFYGHTIDIIKVDKRMGVKLPYKGIFPHIVVGLGYLHYRLLHFFRDHRLFPKKRRTKS
jgi:hypothetical protein